MNKYSKIIQRGFSLVELMVAMLLGLVLIGGIMHVVVSNIQTFNSTEGIARVQENARFALGELSKNIRQVGFKGCMSENPIVPSAGALYDLSAVDIISHDVGANANSITVGSVTINNVQSDTQAITIKKLVDIGAFVTADSSSTIVNANAGLENINAGDVLFVGDCEKSDIVGIQDYNKNTSTIKLTGAGLSKNYPPGSAIYKVEVVTYYIGDSAFNVNGTAVQSLYKHTIRKGATPANEVKKDELVVGVDNIEFLYGVKTETGLQFHTANALSTANTPKVSIIRVRVTTNSITPVAGEKIKRDFTVSVGLRNRSTNS